MQKIFETRKETIKKKAGELASRCNVDVCVLCFGPDGSFDQWPADPVKAASVIKRYREATRRESKCKRGETLILSDVLDAKIKTLQRQLDARRPSSPAAHGGIGALGFPLWEEEIALLPKESLLALSSCLESKIRAINGRIESLTAKPTMELGFSQQDNCLSDQHTFANSQVFI